MLEQLFVFGTKFYSLELEIRPSFIVGVSPLVGSDEFEPPKGGTPTR
jgi:hypothetical protein